MNGFVLLLSFLALSSSSFAGGTESLSANLEDESSVKAEEASVTAFRALTASLKPLAQDLGHSDPVKRKAAVENIKVFLTDPGLAKAMHVALYIEGNELFEGAEANREKDLAFVQGLTQIYLDLGAELPAGIAYGTVHDLSFQMDKVVKNIRSHRHEGAGWPKVEEQEYLLLKEKIQLFAISVMLTGSEQALEMLGFLHSDLSRAGCPSALMQPLKKTREAFKTASKSFHVEVIRQTVGIENEQRVEGRLPLLNTGWEKDLDLRFERLFHAR